MSIPFILKQILYDLNSIGAKSILVGGCVRDHFLNISCKDYDIEIFNIYKTEELSSSLSKYSNVKFIGKSFGVLSLKIDNVNFDFALARSEIKTGFKHQDFKVNINSPLSYKEAALRRDFTINSIGYDFFKNDFLDPFNGIKDLKCKKLKHINTKTFIEDPLRVYRAISFASRFEFNLDKTTFKLCKQMVKNNDLNYLPKERIYTEFKKIFLKSNKPSLAFILLKDLGILKCFCEFKDINLEVLRSLDNLVKVIYILNIKDEYRILYLFYCILCQKLTKKSIQTFLYKLTNEKRIIQIINNLLVYQNCFNEITLESNLTIKLKKLSLHVNIEDLAILYLSKISNTNKNKCQDIFEYILTISTKLNIKNKAIKPLINGKDLISLGLKPSKKFKNILQHALDLQIEKNLTKDKILKLLKVTLL